MEEIQKDIHEEIAEWRDMAIEENGERIDYYDAKSVKEIDVHFLVTDEEGKVSCHNGGIVPLRTRLKVEYRDNQNNVNMSVMFYTNKGRKIELKAGRLKSYQPITVFALIGQGENKVMTKKYLIKDSKEKLYLGYENGKLEIYYQEEKKEA